MNNLPEFREPATIEKFLNRAFGFLVSIGMGPSYIYVLQVRGRKSGRVFETPVNLLEMSGKQFLVAPRGRAQWVRNAEVAGRIILKRGSSRQQFQLRPLGETEKLPILKEYLDRYRSAVQRYFPVSAGSPAEAFVDIQGSYPAYELIGDGQP